MAEITNGMTGGGRIGVRIEIEEVEPKRGMIARGHNVAMNSDLGLLWARVSLLAGEAEIYTQRILLHSIDVRSWTEKVIEIASFTGREEEQAAMSNRVLFDDMTSPELKMRLEQSLYFDPPSADNLKAASYELLVIVNHGFPEDDPYVESEGPGMYLEPEAESVVRFARELRSEMEMALLLADWTK